MRVLNQLLRFAGLSLVFIAVSLHASDNLNVVYSFNPHSGASNPIGALTMDSSGNLYGQSNNSGTAFELTPNGSGGYNFAVIGDCPDGLGSLALDHAGNLYAVTIFGNICEFSPDGSGGWTTTTIYSFSDGDLSSPVIADGAGNLYGETFFGGSNNLGYIYELSLGSGGWTLTDLHDFSGSDGSGGFGAELLMPALTMNASGVIYGTTFGGGSAGYGVIFKLNKIDGAWQETVLHNFQGSDGMYPDAPLLIDSAGNLYGTTTGGGSDGFGVVFEASNASGEWRTGVLHNFASGTDGAYPNSGLVMDSSGNLYGATLSGGGSSECAVENDNGCGMVFALLHQDGKWKEMILTDFTGFNGGISGGVTIDAAGHLYGGAQGGGRYGAGYVFEFLLSSE
jgi:uncharacterized repeat protein (TIGR03803 family)